MLKFLSAVMLLGAIAALTNHSHQPINGTAESHISSILRHDVKIKKIKSSSEKNRLISLAEEKMRETIGDESLKAKETRIVHDFVENEYLFVSFGSIGYDVVNVANDDVVEISPFAGMPFSDEDNAYYVPWIGYFRRLGNLYFNVQDGHELSHDEVEKLKEESSRFAAQSVIDATENQTNANLCKKAKVGPKKTATPPTNNPINSGIIYADHEVPYSWFFKRNYNQFPTNDTGTCGYVSASMLLAYNEIFKSTGYFSAKESADYITPYVGSFSPNGWNGVPDLSDSFPKSVWGKNIGSSVPSTVHSAIDLFMNGKNKLYEVYEYVWKFATITDPVKEGCPAAYFGNIQSPTNSDAWADHVVTVYGYYNDGKLLVHYGWEGYSQVVMSQLGIFKQGGVIAIYNKSEHVHNDRYFVDRSTGKRYCGCGRLMSC